MWTLKMCRCSVLYMKPHLVSSSVSKTEFSGSEKSWLVLGYNVGWHSFKETKKFDTKAFAGPWQYA